MCIGPLRAPVVRAEIERDYRVGPAANAAEDELDAAIDAVRGRLGSESTITRVRTVDIEPLGPFVLIAALLPLSFLLIRRNLA